MKRYDVAVVENAVVDILLKVGDSDLSALGLRKGTSAPMDGRTKEIEDYFKRYDAVALPGGSGANIAVHSAGAGAKTAFLGTVGNDEYGSIIENDFRSNCVDPYLSKKPGSTGVCYTLITPDGERTFAFNGGQTCNYTVNDLDIDVIRKAKYLSTSLYALSEEPQKSAVLRAMKAAKKAGTIITLDFANAPTVSSNRKFVRRLLAEYVDIAFANHNEAEALSGDLDSAQRELERLCRTSIIKLGAKGSLIIDKHKKYRIPAFPAKKVVDTTGAGDSYLGVFLAHLASEESIEDAGIAASKKAADIVSRVGAR